MTITLYVRFPILFGVVFTVLCTAQSAMSFSLPIQLTNHLDNSNCPIKGGYMPYTGLCCGRYGTELVEHKNQISICQQIGIFIDMGIIPNHLLHLRRRETEELSLPITYVLQESVNRAVDWANTPYKLLSLSLYNSTVISDLQLVVDCVSWISIKVIWTDYHHNTQVRWTGDMPWRENEPVYS